MEKANVYVPCKAVTVGPKHHFFGYYDKSPWDSSGRYLLAMETDFNDRLPNFDDIVVIGLVDSENQNRFSPIAQTSAWNWQQGAMAQWVPTTTAHSIIYNDIQDGKIVSILLDVDTGKRQILPLPIYTLAPDGRYAFTIDFSRLYRFRPSYSYAGLNNVPILPDKETGIHRLDLHTGQYELQISYAEIVAFQYDPIMEQAQHWVDHLLVNPDGSRILFYHRFSLPDGTMYSRLLTQDLTSNNSLHCLILGSVSHNCWKNDHQIIAWARQRSFQSQTRIRNLLNLPSAKFLLRWMHRQQGNWVRQRVIGDSFLLLDDDDFSIEVVASGIITEDGHPSFSSNGRWLLLDTYPDASNHRHLFLYDWHTNKRVPLGSFFSPPTITGGIRCDLHPRWSRDGRYVCIDSTHDGTRQMYVLDVHSICI